MSPLKEVVTSGSKNLLQRLRGLGGRRVALVFFVICLCTGVVAAGIVFFTTSADSNVQDPIENKTMQFFADQWTNRTFVFNDNPDSSYLLRIELTEFAGNTTSDAYLIAQQDSNEAYPEGGGQRCGLVTGGDGFIACFFVENTTKNFDEEVRRGLLSDGAAMYYNVPKNGDGKLRFKVRSTDAGEVTISRTSKIPDNISVRNHRQIDTENCGNCHNTASPVLVHQSMGATTDTPNPTDWKSGTCKSCHDNTMTDLHQDCDNACHDDGYPIIANQNDPNERIRKHDPNNLSRPNMIQGEYFCGADSGCHGTYTTTGESESSIALTGAIGPTHVWELSGTGGEENTGYCIKCHTNVARGNTGSNKTITDLHEDTGKSGCTKCHGVPFRSVHEPAWNMGMNSKSDCGTDGCHPSD